MPRVVTTTQAVNAAKITSLGMSIQSAQAQAIITVDYVVGTQTGDVFTPIPGVARSALASVTVPLSTTLAAGLAQVQQAIATTEGLDLAAPTAPDQVLAP